MTADHENEERLECEASFLKFSKNIPGMDLAPLGYVGVDDDGPTAVSDLFEDVEGLYSGLPEYLTEEERLDAQRKAKLLRGAIAGECYGLIDDLFDDIAYLRRVDEAQRTEGVEAAKHPELIERTEVLSRLPSAFVHAYTYRFAQELLTIASDMATQLANDTWRHPTCTAQELTAHLLLDRVEMEADMCGVDFGERWRECLEGDWFVDEAVAELYEVDEEDAVVRHLRPAEAAKVEIKDWFQPFNGDLKVPLYAYFEPNPWPATPEYKSKASGERPFDSREERMLAGDLIDVSAAAAEVGFTAPVAISKGALECLGIKDVSDESEETLDQLYWVLSSAGEAGMSWPGSVGAPFELDLENPTLGGPPLKLGMLVTAGESQGAPALTVELAARLPYGAAKP